MISTNPSKVYTIRPLDLTDIKQVGNLHQHVFPDYFLTHMGVPFLELFYQQFTERPGYGVIACVDNKVIGFVTGTSDSSLLYKKFYKNHFLKLFMITITRFIGDSVVRKSIFSRVPHIKKALLSIIPFINSNIRHSSQKAFASSVTTRLLSIGIDPNFRGMGIAEEITDRFCEQLRNDGFKTIGLSVFNDNPRAIRFYEKSGWQIEFSTEKYIYFIRST